MGFRQPAYGTLPAAALILLAAFLFLAGGCAHRREAAPIRSMVGVASWYGDDFHGRATSSGERYNMYRLTAASTSIPLGSTIKVTRLDNGKSVILTVNDRGPFVPGRILDLSYEAARRLDLLKEGLTQVRIDVLTSPTPPSAAGPAPSAGPETKGTVSVAASSDVPPPAAPKPPAEAAPAAKTAGTVSVSLGIFATERTAAWKRDDIKAGFPAVSVSSRKSGESVLWEVYIGPLPKAEAESVLKTLQDRGIRGRLIEKAE